MITGSKPTNFMDFIKLPAAAPQAMPPPLCGAPLANSWLDAHAGKPNTAPDDAGGTRAAADSWARGLTAATDVRALAELKQGEAVRLQEAKAALQPHEFLPPRPVAQTRSFS